MRRVIVAGSNPLALCLMAILWLGALGCGGGGKAGTAGGPCYGNMTCNLGLVCLSQLCVNPRSSDGAAETVANGGTSGGGAGSGGSTGAAGTGGIGATGGADAAAVDSGNSAGPDASGDVAPDATTEMDAHDATVDDAPCPGAGCLKPQQLVPPGATCGAMHLAVTNSDLFWTDTAASSVLVLTTATGTFGGFQSLQDAPTLIAATDKAAYWLNSTSQTIRTSNQSSASGLFASPQGGVNAMRLSPGNPLRLYVSVGTAVRPYPQFTAIAVEETGTPVGIAFDASNIAFAVMGDNDIDVVSLVINYGTSATCTAPTSSNPSIHCGHVATAQSALLLDTLEMADGKVIWANGATLYSRPADLSTPMQALASTAFGGAVTTLVLHGSTIYLGEEGYIERAPLTPVDKATVLATDQNHPHSMVADATHIYWVDADCSIMNVTP